MLLREIVEFDVMEAYFLQALYWSVGAGLLEEGRVKFDGYVKYLASLTQNGDDEQLAGPGESEESDGFKDVPNITGPPEFAEFSVFRGIHYFPWNL